jgi:hypothetical protein
MGEERPHSAKVVLFVRREAVRLLLQVPEAEVQRRIVEERASSLRNLHRRRTGAKGQAFRFPDSAA